MPDYEGYEASSEGRIRHVVYRILPGYAKEDRYLMVNTKRVAREGRVSVHAMVASAFHGPKPPGLIHNHKDGNKLNNRPDNLEYVTYSQNLQHAYDVLKRPRNAGSRHGRSKLTEADVQIIRELRGEGQTLTVIAKRFNVCASMICHIVNRKNWTHV